MTELTLADYAEAWHRDRGIAVPKRETAEWLEMYERWVDYAFENFGESVVNDPPAWMLGQDPERCEECGGLLAETENGTIYCTVHEAAGIRWAKAARKMYEKERGK